MRANLASIALALAWSSIDAEGGLNLQGLNLLDDVWLCPSGIKKMIMYGLVLQEVKKLSWGKPGHHCPCPCLELHRWARRRQTFQKLF